MRVVVINIFLSSTGVILYREVHVGKGKICKQEQAIAIKNYEVFICYLCIIEAHTQNV